MKITSDSPDSYIDQLPEERKKVMTELRSIIRLNLPLGFEEQMSYGMIGYVVPHSRYPSGYHVDPALPLPFINLASQKNHIALYHFGIYADEKLFDWFRNEYPKHSDSKPDIGKSCIRFKNPAKVPVKLIGELVSKMSVDEWIRIYEKNSGAGNSG